MNISPNIICATLTAASVLACAGQAQTNDPTRTDDRDRRQSESMRYSDAGIAQSVLQELEGVWKIEVQASNQFLNMQQDTRLGTNPRDAAIQHAQDAARQRESNRDRNNDTTRDESDRTRTNDSDQRRTPERSYGSNDSRNAGEVVELRGVCENKLVLGDKIQQHFVIVDAEHAENLGRTNASSRTADRGENEMEGISYFTFDPQADRYSAIFMSESNGRIMQKSGAYDASRKRVVFNESDLSSNARSSRSMNDRSDRFDRESERPGRDSDRLRDSDDRRDTAENDRLTRRDDTRREDTTRRDTNVEQNDRAYGDTSALSDVVVVLELVDDDTHVVTMYRSNAYEQQFGRTSDPSSNRERMNRTDRANESDRTDRDNRTERTNDRSGTTTTDRRSNRADTGSPSELGEGVLYRATFTRAEANQEDVIRQELASTSQSNIGR